MKKDRGSEESILVTKENFHDYLLHFKKALKSDLLLYVVLNADISSDPKLPTSEIVYNEFTLVRKVNTNNDIEILKETYLIPSIKFHRYSNDEIITFNSSFLNYLTHEKYSYDFNSINKSISCTYENIDKEKLLADSLELILRDGKQSKKEGKSSYNYFPKALEIPSKKYQKLIENYLKFFSTQICEGKGNKIFVDPNKTNEEEDHYYIDSDKYEKSFKIINDLFEFPWVKIFKPYEINMIKLSIRNYKIEVKNNFKINENFNKYIKELYDFFKPENKENETVIILKNEYPEEFYNLWKKYFEFEHCEVYSFENIPEHPENKKLVLAVNKAEIPENGINNENKYHFFNSENICTFLLSILGLHENMSGEPIIHNIKFRKIDMSKLLPIEYQNSLNIYYNLCVKIDPVKLKKNISEERAQLILEDRIPVINYTELFIKNDKSEEILFGYNYEGQIHDLFKNLYDSDDENIFNKFLTRTTSIELGNDISKFLTYEEYKNVIDQHFAIFEIEKANEKEQKNFYIIKMKLKNDFNFDNLKPDIVDLSKNLKRKLLIEEEIGVTLFYNELFFSKNKIKIFGTNLKYKLQYIFENLFDKNLDKIISKINCYDISYICNIEKIDWFMRYLELKIGNEIELKRYITQRLAIIVHEYLIKKKVDIEKYKNVFYEDNKEKLNKMNSIEISKEKFTVFKAQIIKSLQRFCDFSINDEGKNIYINLLDNNKLEIAKKEIEKIQ